MNISELATKLADQIYTTRTKALTENLKDIYEAYEALGYAPGSGKTLHAATDDVTEFHNIYDDRRRKNGIGSNWDGRKLMACRRNLGLIMQKLQILKKYLLLRAYSYN